ncbi:MAG: hypothetical protein ACK40K_00760 [Raineya sp.]
MKLPNTIEAMCFRNLQRTIIFARWQGVMNTLRKQGFHLWQALLNIYHKNQILLRYTQTVTLNSHLLAIFTKF